MKMQGQLIAKSLVVWSIILLLTPSILNADTVTEISLPAGSWNPNIKVQRSENHQIDISHIDYIMYYEVLDNWLSLDLGMTVKNINGKISLPSANLSSDLIFNEYIPAMYGKVNVQLPTTGMSIGAVSSALNYGDHSISDYKIYLGWDSHTNFGAELGYRRFNADWQDFNSSDGDVSVDGYYATVTFHF